jgi:hypothetical protein
MNAKEILKKVDFFIAITSSQTPPASFEAAHFTPIEQAPLE